MKFMRCSRAVKKDDTAPSLLEDSQGEQQRGRGGGHGGGQDERGEEGAGGAA